MAASEEAAERNDVGARLLEQDKTNAAIAEFQRALSLDPRYFPAHLNLAYAYERADRIEDAMETYREAINLRPRNFFAQNNLRGPHDAAISEFGITVATETDNAMALKNREKTKQRYRSAKLKSGKQRNTGQTERFTSILRLGSALRVLWKERIRLSMTQQGS